MQYFHLSYESDENSFSHLCLEVHIAGKMSLRVVLSRFIYCAILMGSYGIVQIWVTTAVV